MMIRLFNCTLLLSLAFAAQANTLYRWVEADGSITFSPNKPAAGIDYQVIGEEATSSAAQTRGKAGTQKPNAVLTSSDADQRGVDASVSWMNSVRRDNQAVQVVEPPFAAARPAAPQQDSAPQFQRNADVRSVATSNKRSRQCAELNMRVTSLEERMKARLTPEAMDRTVMSMARYQKSLDSFCR